MIADIGKSVCVATAPNGEVYGFWNSVIESKDTVSYYSSADSSIPRYTLIYNEVEKKLSYRALHYARFLPNGVLDTTPRVVPLRLEESEAGSSEVHPLYEAISPGLGKLPGKPGLQLMFWTNLSDKAITLEQNPDGSYRYDADKVLKFENDKLEEVELDNYSIKLLCAATLVWEKLKSTGGVLADPQYIHTPVVYAIHILMVQSGNIAIDFSGGSGNGMRRHNHADNNNGGFAYAVFAPGTSLQPIAWY